MKSSLRNIFLLAMNGFNDVVRNRFFYGIATVALIIIGMGVVLGSLSMSEEQRITTNFGLLSIQIILLVTAIFFGSLSITKDIERKILMTLITKPLTRAQYIVGKFLSIALVLFVSLCVLGFILSILLYYFGTPINDIYMKALWGIYLESLVLLSISICFGVFSTPFLIVCYTFSFFIVGHWVDTMKEIITESDALFFRFLVDRVLILFPNLEKFNWRPHVVYQDFVPTIDVLFYSFYAFAWVGFALTLSMFIFNRRDFI